MAPATPALPKTAIIADATPAVYESRFYSAREEYPHKDASPRQWRNGYKQSRGEGGMWTLSLQNSMAAPMGRTGIHQKLRKKTKTQTARGPWLF